MASVVVCDGCGESASPDASSFVKVGVASEKEYCPKCSEVAVEFLRKRDDLHGRLAEQWKEGMDQIEAEFGERLNELPS